MNDGGWMYACGKLAAARELARKQWTSNDFEAQSAICREYGVFLEQMTADEICEFENLVKGFMGNDC